jgi:uncharacterized protein YkwD
VTTAIRPVRQWRARLAAAACLALAAPAAALDLNSFRAQHRLPRLAHSAVLAGAAYAHAHDLANRNHLDHDGYRSRMGAISSTAAENVAYGCASEDCVIRMWARSAGHRRNMLMKGISRYGSASAKSSYGRNYWVLDFGN